MTELEQVVKEVAQTLRDWAQSSKETAEKMDRRIAESRERTDALIAESRRETDAVLAATLKQMRNMDSRIGNRIGDLTETILVPGLRFVLNGFGHEFTSLSPNRKFYTRGDKGGKKFAEVDLYLENGPETMAVEVKTHMKTDDVEYHLKRLLLLREREAVTGLRGKTLLGAMAGLDIDVEASDMALGLGMYVIEMVEDTRYVHVIKPTGELGKW